jgi:two-component system, OmpR family, copper resistance phosphate regulon response regulator CusR
LLVEKSDAYSAGRDDAKVSSFVARGSTEERFAMDVAADGKSGLDLATTYHYDLVILDLMLPTLDGSQVLRRLRTENVQVPALILTAPHRGSGQSRQF